ncbi:MAG: GNAT family N-acetyltransferase [bacterium]|nr:GNAT family N-acetyltransferase [bacterium]
MLKENKVSDLDVVVENLSFFEVFQVQKYLDDLEIAKKAFGVLNESPQLFENISKLKKNLVLNRSSFKSIKYNRKTVGFIQIHYETSSLVKIGIVIGEKKYWGKNIGSIALKKMVTMLFKNDKNINVITLDTASYNVVAKKCFEKVGFKVYKEQDGKVYMQLLRQDYQEEF